MDTPVSHRKKRDPEANKRTQKLYRKRMYASVNGIEKVKALHRRRYHQHMANLKAKGEYEAFKAKKLEYGMKRYYAMSEEKRSEVKKRNAQAQKNWMQKMKEEGTFEAYKERVNERRRQLRAEKQQALGEEGWRALQKDKYQKRIQAQQNQRLAEHLERPFPLPWWPLDWSDSEFDEDPVQSTRSNALQQLQQYL